MVPRHPQPAGGLPGRLLEQLDELLRAAAEDETGRQSHLLRASRLLAEQLGADRVTLLVPAGADAYRVVAGTEAESIGDVLTALDRHPELERVRATGLPVLVGDVATSELMAPVLGERRRDGEASLMAAPVRLPDVEAVLRAVSRRRPFGRDDLRRLAAVADHLERTLVDPTALEARSGGWAVLARMLADAVLEVAVDGRITAVHQGPSDRLPWPDDLRGSLVGRALRHADGSGRPVQTTDIVAAPDQAVLALAAVLPGREPVRVRAAVSRTTGLPPRVLVALTAEPAEPAAARGGAPAEEREASLRARLEETLAELERLELRLSQVEVSRHRFVSASAHELKTPITVIQSYLEIVLDDLGEDLGDEQRSFLSIAHENVLRLRRLVTDLVDLAAMDSGRIQLEIGRVDVGPLLERVGAELSPLARRADIDLAVEVGSPPPVVRGAAERIEQILRNLVDNALKFTAPGGLVTLRARALGDTVVLDVADTGQGIAADRLDTLFDEFVQAGPSLDPRRRGAGLGLSIARRVALALGGRITVASREGEGSTFSVWLPRWPEE